MHYNIRDLERVKKEFESAVKYIRWNIIGLSEICRKGEKLVQPFLLLWENCWPERYRILYKRKNLGKGNRSKSNSITDWIAQTQNRKQNFIYIIQVYASTSFAEDNEMETFY